MAPSCHRAEHCGALRDRDVLCTRALPPLLAPHLRGHQPPRPPSPHRPCTPSHPTGDSLSPQNDPRAQLYPCTSYSAFSVHSYISPIHSLHSGSLRGDAPPMALSISGAGVRVHAGHTSTCNVCTETAPSQSRNSREKQMWGETPHSRQVPRSKFLVSSPPALNILQLWLWSRNPRARCTC